MSLTEIMQNADLSLYPKIGLIIFTGIFAMVCYRTMRLKQHTDVDRLAHLALEEDAKDISNTDSIGSNA